jgi:hypothetical protein
MQTFIKVQKKELSHAPDLHQKLYNLSIIVKESESSFLYHAADGKISVITEKLKHENIPFTIVSQSNLSLWQIEALKCEGVDKKIWTTTIRDLYGIREIIKN